MAEYSDRHGAPGNATVRLSAAPSSNISCPVPRPQARVRLFCFPHAGSGVAQFHPWAHLLPARVELRSVQLPGRESRLREAPFRTVGEAIQPIVEALLPQLDRPFGFFGHSMGA